MVDSKKLTDEEVRERVYAELTSHPKIMWCASVISNEKIDEINILQATMLAMRESTCGLIKKHKISASALKSHIALIDGNRVPSDMPVEAKFVIKVSSLSLALTSVPCSKFYSRILPDLCIVDCCRETLTFIRSRQHRSLPKSPVIALCTNSISNILSTV